MCEKIMFIVIIQLDILMSAGVLPGGLLSIVLCFNSQSFGQTTFHVYCEERHKQQLLADRLQGRVIYFSLISFLLEVYKEHDFVDCYIEIEIRHYNKVA